MRLRLGTVAVPSLLFVAACAAPPSSSEPDPGNPGDPGSGPGPTSISVDQLATNLGVSIMAKDAHGAPRLIRAIVPRAGLPGATAAAVARDHLAALAQLWVKGAPMDLVETSSQQLRNGATFVQLAQHVNGAVVDGGELRMLLHIDGSFAAVSGTLLPATTLPAFTSSPREALGHALDQQFGTTRPALAISEGSTAGDWQTLQVASTPELRVDEARARRVVATVDDQLKPAWEVEVIGVAAPDPLSEVTAPVLSAHSMLVDDLGGNILRDVDLDLNDAFVYRAYAETTGNRRPLDGPLQSFSPHPTGVPDGSGPGPISSNLVVMEAFNGPHDKWLADDAAFATGNNVEVFADLDGNSQFGPGEVRPEVRSRRILNFTYDQTVEPLATPDQLKAGGVNAFFIVNWMHDWWYDSGFTEATRDGQSDNFGRGGVANDPLLIAAQAGANAGSRNNASMATPADGARPRMRMFLWTAGADSAFTGPSGAAPSVPFGAGPRNFSLTAEVAIGVDGTAPTDDGCQTLTGVTGKIALLTYVAVCNSQTMVNNAKAAGAIGVIIADGLLEIPRSNFGGSAAANIPGLAIGKSDGVALAAAIAAGPVTVTIESASRGPERDGDLDATVVAHEWGHYLHHRLANCGNSQQCAGMSEGWGDFNALMLMLREGDNRQGVYAMAPYALADGTADTAYFGIRRFPYSRDRTKNDMSFRHIDDANPVPTTTPGHPSGAANSEVHNTGEIWAEMMWEVLNTIVDEHDVTIGRRRMSDYVVAGLLLAPTNATFTEQRDAILAGASVLDTDDMLLMAAAFAGRGIGSCAVSPPRASRTNSGVVESGTIAAKLAAGTATVTDDGPRGDRDGILEPNEAGFIHLTVANGGPLAAEQVTLTATSSDAGVKIGAPSTLPLLPPFSSTALTIPVSVLASVPNGTSVTLTLHVAADQTCDPAGITITQTITIGASMVARAPELDGIAASSGAPVIRMAPATSLRNFDAGVCIAQDTP